MATRASRRPTKEAVGSIAPMIVGTANFCVATSFGSECALTELEAKLLIPSTQRVLERMPAAAAQRASVILDPLIILTVVAMWGRRIAQIKDREAKEKYQITPQEAARANGAVGTTFSVPDNAPPKETITSTDAPVDASAFRQSAQSAEPATVNNGVHYGVPESIRGSLTRDDF